MSTAAKLTLLGSIAFTSGIIYWVVKKQNSDLESLHEGVIRDTERQVRGILKVWSVKDKADVMR